MGFYGCTWTTEADTLQRISESGGLGPVALEALLAEDIGHAAY